MGSALTKQRKRSKKTLRLFASVLTREIPFRREAAVGCPFGVRAGPHFPKCRPDPILLPESFCVPLRLRVLRGLSRTHPSTLIQFFRPGISSSGPKKYEFSLWISYKVSITSPSGKVKRKRKNSAFPPPEPVGKGGGDRRPPKRWAGESRAGGRETESRPGMTRIRGENAAKGWLGGRLRAAPAAAAAPRFRLFVQHVQKARGAYKFLCFDPIVSKLFCNLLLTFCPKRVILRMYEYAAGLVYPAAEMRQTCGSVHTAQFVINGRKRASF